MKSARTPYLAYSFQVRNASCQPPLVPKLSGRYNVRDDATTIGNQFDITLHRSKNRLGRLRDQTREYSR